MDLILCRRPSIFLSVYAVSYGTDRRGLEETEREMDVNLEGSCLSHGFSDLQQNEIACLSNSSPIDCIFCSAIPHTYTDLTSYYTLPSPSPLSHNHTIAYAAVTVAGLHIIV